MVDNKILDDLCEIFKRINDKNISLEELDEKVEDLDYFFRVMSLVNKSNMKSLASSKLLEKKKNLQHENMVFTSDEVRKIVTSNSIDEMKNQYNIKQLQCMFLAVYGVKPRASQKKQELVQDIFRFFSNEERTKALIN